MPSKTFFHLPAEKRERLLLAAEEEFARVPYAEASINRMIRAAGIPRGSFYMYFRDKEELFHYLLKRYQDGLLQRLERVLEEQGGDLLGAHLQRPSRQLLQRLLHLVQLRAHL